MKLKLLIALQLLLSSMLFGQGTTLPYYTGFDAPSETAGWTEYRTGYISSSSWGLGTAGGFSANGLSHDYNVGGNQSDTVVDWMVSPALNFNGYGRIALKVHRSGFSTPTPDNCEIWFGTGSKDPEVGTWMLIGSIAEMSPQFQWLDTSLDIPMISDSAFIAFKYLTIGAAWSTYGIDNVTISVPTSAVNGNPSDGNSVSVFPNPFKSEFNISLEGKNSSCQMKLFSVTGEEVVSGNLTAGNNVIATGDLAAGFYTLKLFKGDQMIYSSKINHVR